MKLNRKLLILKDKMKRLIFAMAAALCLLSLASCGKSAEPLSGVSVDRKEVKIDGLKKTYRILFISDMHVIDPDQSVDESDESTVAVRKDSFSNRYGNSASYWKMFAPTVDSYRADAVILGGDMVDFCTSQSISILKEGMSEIRTPKFYLRADHDYANWYTKGTITSDQTKALQKTVDSDEEVYILDEGEFLIVGINRSTDQITKTALAKLKEVFAEGKPIILATHVPYLPQKGSSLADETNRVWERLLLWGDGCIYVPDANTSAFMQMLYEKDSPVKAVLCGHLHFRHSDQLTDGIVQYVFDASYKGKVGLIEVSPTGS